MEQRQVEQQQVEQVEQDDQETIIWNVFRDETSEQFEARFIAQIEAQLRVLALRD
jgi:hypothetical protein